jgi:type I restriction enzyme S subunit
MITDLKPYSAMKDSGVEWLGDVPEHWEVRRVKSNVTNVVDQTSEREKDDAYIALEHVQSWTGRIIDAGSDVEFDSQVKRFRRNDVLFGKLRPYLAKVARPVVDGVCVGEFLVLRTDEQAQTSNFLEQVMRSKPVIDVINASTFGAKMPRADWNFIGSLPQALPPLPEQAAIVRYLDHVDRRVRRLVRAKRKLIALLTEQKQAIIHRAVTRGLDPDVPLKDSGVEWLGEVPEHWEVRRLFQACDVIDPHPSHRNPPAVTGGIPFLGVGDLSIDGEVVRLGHTVGRDVLEAQNARFIIEEGDLAIGRVASVGKVVRLRPGDICLSGRLAVLKPKVDSGFLFFSLESPTTKHQITVGTDLTTMGVLGLNKLKRIYLCVPPEDEQAALGKHLGSSTEEINAAITRAEREIELLHEYRTRLIADVVTGKLDVRGAAAALPEVDPLAEDEDTDDLDADLAQDAAELDETLEEAEA